MNRREFSKRVALLGAGLSARPTWGQTAEVKESTEGWFEEPARKLPVQKFDVVVAGGGTAAALCAAKSCGTRDLAYPLLREALLKAGVHLEG